MVEYRLSILHVSDLHARSLEGASDERRARVLREARQRNRVLGAQWDANLSALFPDRSPDLVCFTGDVADWGLSTEYDVAMRQIERLRDRLGVGLKRIFIVPGNHDVQRSVQHEAWQALRTLAASEPQQVSEWLAGGDPPRAVDPTLRPRVLERTAAFWSWVEHALHRSDLCPGRAPSSRHPHLGYRVEVPGLDLPFDVHVVGLDSAWLAGDDHDAQKLRLTRPQIHMLGAAEDGRPLTGFRVALLHHPLDDLADASEVRKELAELVDLVLHGHQHTPAASTWADPDRRLRALAAGCLYEGSAGDRWPNTCQRIDITLDASGRPLEARIRFRSWSPNGFWHDDSALYREAPAGLLVWSPWTEPRGHGTAAQGPRRREEPSPTRVLVLAAEPVDRDRIRTAAQTSIIRNAIEKGRDFEPLHGFVDVGATRIADVPRHVDDVRPDILHIVAPGRADGALALEGAAHETRWLTAAELASLLVGRHPPQLLVLCADQSAEVADELLAISPCVITMVGRMRPKVAITFFECFYEALARGEPIELAFRTATLTTQSERKADVFRIKCRPDFHPSGARLWD